MLTLMWFDRDKWVNTGLPEQEGNAWLVSATGAWLLAEIVREVRELTGQGC